MGDAETLVQDIQTKINRAHEFVEDAKLDKGITLNKKLDLQKN